MGEILKNYGKKQINNNLNFNKFAMNSFNKWKFISKQMELF